MKIFASKRINRTIEIEIEFQDLPQEIAATDKVVKYKDNLSKSQQYTEEQLDWYNDLIESVLHALSSRDFKITDNYQSSESYSYYIQFQAFTYEGQSLGDFEIKFRISDHGKSKNRKSSSTVSQIAKGKNLIFKSLKLNGVSKSGMVDLLKSIWYIGDNLLEGNIEVLDEFV